MSRSLLRPSIALNSSKLKKKLIRRENKMSLRRKPDHLPKARSRPETRSLTPIYGRSQARLHLDRLMIFKMSHL